MQPQAISRTSGKTRRAAVSGVLKRIVIAALLALFGMILFESRGLMAATQVVQNFQAEPNFQAVQDSQVPQNSPAAAPAGPRKRTAPAEGKRLQLLPEARRSAQAQATPAQPQPPVPKIPIRTEISRFDGWIVTCNEFEGGPKTRGCSAQLQILQEKTNQPVFSWTVGLDDNKQLVTVLQTPTGVAIAPGVELRVGKIPARKIPFATCETTRCIATTIVDAALLREMTTSPTAQAVVQGAQGNTVDFNIQMKGFDKAYPTLSHP
jgi:invasion protein IalB